MQAMGISDIAQTFVLQKKSVDLRSDLTRIGEELATGKVADIPAHLGGSFAGLSSIEHKLALLEGWRTANIEAAGFSNTAQLRVENITKTVGEFSASLLSLGGSPTLNVINSLSDTAMNALGATIADLNASQAGRSVFAGVATDAQPLLGMSAILGSARSEASTAFDAASIFSAITDWFNNPAGFEATIYKGSATDLKPFAIGDGRQVTFDVRADRQAFRDTLRDLTVAVLATDGSLGISNAQRGELLAMSAASMLASQDQLINVSAEIGVIQEQIEAAQVRQATEQQVLQTTRNSLIGRDSFQAASELEAVRLQLETVFAVTARTSQLSLVNFLR